MSEQNSSRRLKAIEKMCMRSSREKIYVELCVEIVEITNWEKELEATITNNITWDYKYKLLTKRLTKVSCIIRRLMPGHMKKIKMFKIYNLHAYHPDSRLLGYPPFHRSHSHIEAWDHVQPRTWILTKFCSKFCSCLTKSNSNSVRILISY